MINKLLVFLDEEEKKERNKDDLDLETVGEIFALRDLLKEEIKYRKQYFVEDYYINEIVGIFKSFNGEVEVTENAIVGYFYYTGNFKFETKLAENQQTLRAFVGDEIMQEYANGRHLLDFVDFIFDKKRYYETQEALVADSIKEEQKQKRK